MTGINSQLFCFRQILKSSFDVTLLKSFLLSNVAWGIAISILGDTTFLTFIPAALYSYGWNKVRMLRRRRCFQKKKQYFVRFINISLFINLLREGECWYVPAVYSLNYNKLNYYLNTYENKIAHQKTLKCTHISLSKLYLIRIR